MKTSTVIIFIIVFPITLFAQNAKISGYTKSSADSSVIPFSCVYILNKNIGCISDENGFFNLNAENINNEDSLCISILGYKLYKEKLSTINSRVTNYYLLPKPNIIPEVIITSPLKGKREKILLGNYSKKINGRFYYKPGDQISLYIKSELKVKAKLLSVNFYITNQGTPDTKFRIHLYNQKDGKPNNEIISENIIANAINGEEWVKVDMSKYNIIIPNEGFFISMEWLPESAKNPHSLEFNQGSQTNIFFGQVLGGIIQDTKKESVIYYKPFLKDWKLVVRQKQVINSLNPAITCDIQYYK